MLVSPLIQIGIIGCVEIAVGSRSLSQSAILHAVGSRSLEKAKKFAADDGFPASAKVYGSYEAVLDGPDVDAVYMPLPTALHSKWAVLAAQKQKHLLLEKLVALNSKEFDTILEAFESNGLQLMDATMLMHHPRAAKMKEFISNPDLFGELISALIISSLNADFNFFFVNLQ
ncbi:PREDICTED: uncharacterized oxidoreductase At4g09670-like [Ipomoea nil]|uniref:uncharacterized oxidoreductase At4g09670-like n=1 Tax=Ipomoea nil TaxID=35883 RepID=UPI000901D113|nr:PREDICTED: uncharacterized oxidoreductase At4g09670-like [Ipomoea nil]